MLNHSLVARVLVGGSALVAALAMAAPAQAASCRGCEAFGASCTVDCLGLEAEVDRLACSSACNQAAATCSCDQPTLTAEDAVFLGLVDPGQGSLGGACHSTTPCPPEYGACSAWSVPEECGDPTCGTYKFCGDPPFCEEPNLCFGPATYTQKEKFRVCFNAAQQSCTEWAQVLPAVPTCGC